MLPLLDIANTFTRIYFSKKDKVEELPRGMSDDYTILLTTYNKRDVITETLKKWERYRSKILIVDDGSADGTYEHVKSLGCNALRLDKNTKRMGAILHGLNHITTGYTVLMDDDIWIDGMEIFHTDPLGEAVFRLQNEGIEAVTGEILPVTNMKGNKTMQELQYLDHIFGMRLGKRVMGHGNKKYVQTCGGFNIVKTGVLKRVTEEQIRAGPKFAGDDVERNLLIFKLFDGQVGYDDLLKIRAIGPANLADFTKQRINWSKGALRISLTYPEFLKRWDKLGLVYNFNFWVDVVGHPIKLAALVYLASHPEQLPYLLAMFGSYIGLEYTTMKLILSDDEFKKNWKYGMIFPFYKFYEMIVPTTIGYISEIKRRIDEYRQNQPEKAVSNAQILPQERETDKMTKILSKVPPVYLFPPYLPKGLPPYLHPNASLRETQEGLIREANCLERKRKIAGKSL